MTTPAYLNGLTIERRNMGFAVTNGFGGRIVFGGTPGYTRADAEQDRIAFGDRYPASVVADVAKMDEVRNRVHAARMEIEAIEGPHSVFSAGTWKRSDMIAFCVVSDGAMYEGEAYRDEEGAEALAMERLRDLWLADRPVNLLDAVQAAGLRSVPAVAAE